MEPSLAELKAIERATSIVRLLSWVLFAGCVTQLQQLTLSTAVRNRVRGDPILRL
ncbi:hypothetical protein FNV43_RR09034 [Rhamnella rubrinervis]|uniref:Uncharacterized protein n=1 Tax=Rhamnella rubrinervis TaxID=2594499 RepID=A0A8K0H999_9ROSA|nr:hypothetical protein FNV43_RR09034 [Rhamnella rubrinervis]